MFKNYIKIAFRSFWREKSFSLINIIGLMLGLVAGLFILIWTQHELSYDRFHADGERIYQVLNNLRPSENKVFTWSTSPYPYAKVFKEEVPEVEETAVFWYRGYLFSKDEESGIRESGGMATSSFLDMFSFPLVIGDQETALNTPDALIISEEMAERHFGENWQGEEDRVIGQSLTLDNEEQVKVTGVFKKLPDNSSIKFSFIRPMSSMLQRDPGAADHWGNFNFQVYLKLTPAADAVALAPKLAQVVAKYKENNPPEPVLQNIQDRYLYGQFENGKVAGGRIEYVRIFFIAALFIILIACFNYMNLVTARSVRRAKEVGIRKVVGATRNMLAGQFFAESLLFTFLSLVLAISLGQLLLPQFNLLTGKELTFDFYSWRFWGLVFGIGFLTAFLAGSYPAIMLSSFRIMNVLKGNARQKLGGVNLRRILVVGQFVLSILLIVGALVVREQIDYIKTKNLGMDKNNVLSTSMPQEWQDKLDVVKEKLNQSTAIEMISGTSGSPLSVNSMTSDPSWEGMQEEQRTVFNIITVDETFLNTMKIPLMEGEPFREGMTTDTVNFSYLINEEAAKVMDLEDPIGKRLSFWGFKGRIIGLVKNFHFTSLHDPIEPLILRYQPEWAYNLLVRPAIGKTSEAIAQLETLNKELSPTQPFKYNFLDDQFEAMYKGEAIVSQLANLFALLAIVISCLGLLGLAAFTAERRTKEIGIRKVLGATIGDILVLLNSEFGKLILIAFVIAVPLAVYLTGQWLESFAYHIDLEWSLFAWVAGIILLLTIITVSFHSIRAALSNPAESIRYE